MQPEAPMRRFRSAPPLVVLALSLPLAASAQGADDHGDAAAQAELERLLSDSDARAANAAADPRAAQAEALWKGFPPYAQTELQEIVQMVMQESGAGAVRHADAYDDGGAEAAMGTFSPAVRARIQALEKRLAADPEFNSPENLARLRALFPGFMGSGAP